MYAALKQVQCVATCSYARVIRQAQSCILANLVIFSYLAVSIHTSTVRVKENTLLIMTDREDISFTYDNPEPTSSSQVPGDNAQGNEQKVVVGNLDTSGSCQRREYIPSSNASDLSNCPVTQNPEQATSGQGQNDIVFPNGPRLFINNQIADIPSQGNNSKSSVEDERSSLLPSHSKAKGAKLKLLCSIFFSTLLIISAVLLMLSFILYTSSLQSMEIGNVQQSSSSLLTLSNMVSSVTLAIKDHYSANITVYITNSIPTTSNDTLPKHSEIPYLTGPVWFNYNYFIGPEPIYLLPGSILTYAVHVSVVDLHVQSAIANATTACKALLYLFNNREDYYEFINEKRYFNSIDSFCLQTGYKDFSFNITKPSVYYVGLHVYSNDIVIASNVSVYRVYYNTTGLLRSSDCPYLSDDTPSCKQSNQVNLFSCTGSNWYLVLETSESVIINYSYRTLLLNGCYRIILPILVLVAAILSAGACIMCCRYLLSTLR